MDQGQRYAVYLPSRYTPERRWPLLLLMDPRGRALVPLALVQESAERLGYVVLSSYNTRSDVAVDPNRDALNAMLADAQRDFSLDERRFYLVGFSGTARAAWDFGAELAGHVAGVIGVGAGLPGGARTLPVPAAGPSFAFFGGAGTTDYNYDEVQRLDGVLDQLRWPHRIVEYPGPHSWPEARVMAQALEWMDLQAMRAGLAPVDTMRVDSLFEAEARAARALEAGGHPLDALLRFRSIANDFAGLHETAAAVADTLRLRRTAEVRAERKRRQRIEERQFATARKMAVYFAELRRGTRKPESLARALKYLDVSATQRLASAQADSAESLAAQRRLIHLLTMAGYRDEAETTDSAGVRALEEISEAVRRARRAGG
jgi:predicted esterase